jgi:hypothetical protein
MLTLRERALFDDDRLILPLSVAARLAGVRPPILSAADRRAELETYKFGCRTYVRVGEVKTWLARARRPAIQPEGDR